MVIIMITNNFYDTYTEVTHPSKENMANGRGSSKF